MFIKSYKIHQMFTKSAKYVLKHPMFHQNPRSKNPTTNPSWTHLANTTGLLCKGLEDLEPGPCGFWFEKSSQCGAPKIAKLVYNYNN